MFARNVLSLVCGAFAVCVGAAPTATWIPADSDIVIVAQEVRDRQAIVKIWEKTLEQAGLDAKSILEEDSFEIRTDGSEVDTEAIKKALLGYDKANPRVFDVTALTCAVRLSDPRASAAEFFFYCYIENPKFDLAALNKAVDEVCAKKGALRTRQDGWDRLADAKKPDETILAWRVVPGGVLIVADESLDQANALVAGTAKTAADDAVTRALAPRPDELATRCQMVVRNPKKLLAFIPAEAAERAKLSVGWLWNMRSATFTLDCDREGALTTQLTMTLDTEANAGMAYENLVAGKMMAGMVATNLLGKPDTELGRWLTTAPCERQGTEASVRLNLTPSRFVKLWKECEAIFNPAALMPQEPPGLEGEPLTEEEAHAILDTIEIEEAGSAPVTP